MNIIKFSVLLSRFIGSKRLPSRRTVVSVPWDGKKFENDPKKDKINLKFKPFFFEMLNEIEAQAESKKHIEKRKNEIVKNISFKKIQGKKMPSASSENNQQVSSTNQEEQLQENLNFQYNQNFEVEVKGEKKRRLSDALKNEMIKDMMPPFTSVAQRLLDLNDRRIHPLFIKLGRMPIRAFDQSENSKTEGKKVPTEIRLDKQFEDEKPMIVNITKKEPLTTAIRHEMKKHSTEVRPNLEKKIADVAVESK